MSLCKCVSSFLVVLWKDFKRARRARTVFEKDRTAPCGTHRFVGLVGVAKAVERHRWTQQDVSPGWGREGGAVVDVDFSSQFILASLVERLKATGQ